MRNIKLTCALLCVVIFGACIQTVTAHELLNKDWLYLNNNPIKPDYYFVTSNTQLQIPERIILISATSDSNLFVNTKIIESELALNNVSCKWLLNNVTIESCTLPVSNLTSGYNYLELVILTSGESYFSDTYAVIFNSPKLPAPEVTQSTNNTQVTLTLKNASDYTNYEWDVNGKKYSTAQVSFNPANFAGKQIAYLTANTAGNKTHYEYKFDGLRKVVTPSPTFEKKDSSTSPDFTGLLLISVGVAMLSATTFVIRKKIIES